MDAPATDDPLADLLLDLKHDLGKHLVLPLALLPHDAPGSLVHRTALRALTHTRHGPMGAVSARALWQRFQSELPLEPKQHPRYVELERALTTALAWQHALQQAPTPAVAPADRAALLRDFRAVGGCIERWLRQVQDA